MNKKTEYVIVSDYNKGLVTEEVRKAILSSGRKIIVDSKQDLRSYKGSAVIVPNIHEFFTAVKNNEDIENNAIELQKELDCILVVKMNDAGALIADGTNVRTYPSVANEVLNVSGAGDIFISILTLAIASEKSIDDAVKLANRGCAKAIAKKHPSVSLDDLQ